MSEKELVEGTVNNVGVDTEDMRDPPMGVADFRTMRDSDLLYVDKTELIDRILSKKGIQSFLFTRPRRFGKSLNLSMLDAYFNMKYKGQAEAWFSGLGISRLRPDDPLMNSYPVVRMSLMGLVTDSTDKFCITLGTRMAKVYWEFDYLKESEAINEDQRAYFNAISGNTNDPALLSASILNLCMLLERHHNRKVVLLIDEYDNPVNNSYDRLEVQKEILGIVRGLLENGIKDNDSIAFTVVTGVMQIAKEGIFSGLNNVYVDNVFSTGFEDMFGFTAEEVQNICTESENPDAFDTAREWYDGYRFGNADIYNPWSVLEYVSRGFTAGDYWTGTGGDAIIKDIVRNTDSPMYGEILEMIDGGTIQSPLDPRITFSDAPASTRTSAYSVMVMSGYLNATPDDILKGVYNLTFPNLEVRMMFSRIIVTAWNPNRTRGR